MTRRDPDAPTPVIDLAAHRQRVPTLPDVADRLLDDVTGLPGRSAVALTEIAGLMFGVDKDRAAEMVATWRTGDGRVRISLEVTGGVAEVAALERFAAQASGRVTVRDRLALSDHEARVLAVLSPLRWDPTAKIAEEAGLDTADTRRALRELDRRGLAMGVAGEWRRL